MRIPLLFLVLLIPVEVRARAITIQNASFEAPAIAAGTFATTSAPAGWSAVGAIDFGSRTIGVLNPSSTVLYTVPAPHGNNVGVVFLMDDFFNQALFSNQPAGMQQTLSTLLQPSTRYTLEVAVGNIGNDPAFPHNQFQFGGFPGYRVELLAGGVVIGADANTLLPPAAGFVTSKVEVDIGTAHAQLGQPLTIRLLNLNAALGIEVNFDDVRLTATSAWTALGPGKAGTLGVPTLRGSGPLLVGSSNTLELTAAAPNSVATLFVGLSEVDLPLLQGVLVPAPQIALTLPVDAQGALVLPFVWPSGLPAGSAIYFQYWIPDSQATLGVAASNGLRGVVP
jgi:hypothetical protein